MSGAMLLAAEPHSDECERAVLGAALLEPESVAPRVAELLQADDFADIRCRTIFGALADVVKRGETVDLRSMQATLELAGKFDAVGGISGLGSLDLDLPDVRRVDSYIGVLRDRSARRKLGEFAVRLRQRAFDGNTETSDLLAAAAADLETIESRATVNAGNLAPLDQGLDEVADGLSRVGGEVVGLPSGLHDLDRLTMGFCPGQLVTIAGRPGTGKSALAQNIAQKVGLLLDHNVAVVSLEMSKIELAQRIIASVTGVDHGKIRGNYLTALEKSQVVAGIEGLRRSKLCVDDSASASSFDIGVMARRQKMTRGLDLLIVDYLQLVTPPQRREGNRALEVADITRQLKKLAMELRIPVIALSQLNRESEKAKRRPVLSDLRDSGAIEQDSDVVIFVHRDAEANESDSAELIVAKNRSGGLGIVEVEFKREILRFRSLAGTRRPA